MSKPISSSRDDVARVSELPRPEGGPGGGDSRESGKKAKGELDSDAPADPHPGWLRNWRSLRTGFDGCGVSSSKDARVLELQNRIAHTPAHTLEGLQAQAELISELAWNDVVASTARELLKGIKRLRRCG